MVWLPQHGGAVQRVKSDGKPASGYVLKFYAEGTSTNIPFATDSTGDTTANYGVYNSLGDVTVSGTPVIPHLDRDFKLAVYATQAAADANTGAVLTIDNNIFDVSAHVVDNDTFQTINVTGDATFGDNIFVANTTHTTILKEKVVELEIVAGVLTIDLSLGTYFIYTNTETHDIVFENLPEVSDGYGRTFMVTIYDSGDFTTTITEPDYTVEIRAQDGGMIYTDKAKFICSICEVGKLFIGIQNGIV
jgi:hypothetical protein